MTFKRLLILTTLFLTINGYAQEKDGEQPSSEDRAKGFVQRLNEKIPFNKQKRDSLVIVFKGFYDDLQTYRIDGNKEVMNVLVQKRDTKVKEVLANDEQYALYQKYMEDMKAQREKRMKEGDGQQSGHRGGGRRGGGMGGSGGGGMGGMRQGF